MQARAITDPRTHNINVEDLMGETEERKNNLRRRLPFSLFLLGWVVGEFFHAMRNGIDELVVTYASLPLSLLGKCQPLFRFYPALILASLSQSRDAICLGIVVDI